MIRELWRWLWPALGASVVVLLGAAAVVARFSRIAAGTRG